MKSFKDYLTESKQTYDFKIKIAGECPENCSETIKAALGEYDCASCSSCKKSPIQETHYDFPQHKNVEVSVLEVSLNYPATSQQVRHAVSNALGLTESCVIVRSPAEEAESILNHANDKSTDESLLEKEYDEKTDGQDLVGEKQKFNLLKQLSKTKHQGEQYKGVNEKLLAKKAPSEKAVKAEKVSASKSPLGSTKIEKPTAASAKGR